MPDDHFRCPLCLPTIQALQQTNGVYECSANSTDHTFVLRFEDKPGGGRVLVKVALQEEFPVITMSDLGPG